MTTTITQEEQLKNLRQQENNSFPVAVFNPAIQAIINNAETELRFAPDWTATSLLYAASAAIGRALEIQHSPDWHEGPTLYACLIGPPGTGKTHPLTKVSIPGKVCQVFRAKVYHLFRGKVCHLFQARFVVRT